MVQTWFDADGLYHKYGTLKATANKAGEYKTYGPLRELELKIDISTLTTTAAVQSDQVFFPKGVFIEDVVLEVQTAAATITTLSVGMVQSDTRAVAGTLTDTCLISALALASITPAGQRITFIPGVTSVGAAIGTAPISSSATFTGMLTAKITGSVGTGIVIVRIHYRTVQ